MSTAACLALLWVRRKQWWPNQPLTLTLTFREGLKLQPNLAD